MQPDHDWSAAVATIQRTGSHMTTVWVVTAHYGNDVGDRVWGVFSSEEAARSAAEAKFQRPDLEHWQWTSFEVDAYETDVPSS